MKKKRLIPILLLKNGWLVKSKGFCRYQNLGNPSTAVKRLSEWDSDELIFLDISTDDVYDIRRDDQSYANPQSFLEIIDDISKVTFMPITVGGKVRSLLDIEQRLVSGADKVSINYIAVVDKTFIKHAAQEFGSQCIVVSIDVRNVDGKYLVFSDGGEVPVHYDVIEWSAIVEDMGAGEILLNSIDRDGMGNGYDMALLRLVSENVNIPVIACGGVGEWEHFAEALEGTNVDAVAAANIFHFVDQSVFLAKKYLYDKGFNVRNPDLINI